MLSKRMEEALNAQINAETYSGYLYVSMAAFFESQGLPGAAQWMKSQAEEEIFHATRFYNFVNERNGRVTLKAIEAPPTVWDTPLTVFQDALAHEEKVTGLINDLVNLAIEEKDHATNNFLQWFVKEQVEEEASVNEVIDQLKMVGDGTGGGMFMLDRELGQRVFTPPPEEE